MTPCRLVGGYELLEDRTVSSTAKTEAVC